MSLLRALAPAALLTLALLGAPPAAASPTHLGTVALTFPDPAPGATLRTGCGATGCGIGLSSADYNACGPTAYGDSVRTGDRYYYGGLRVATNVFAGAEGIGLDVPTLALGDCPLPDAESDSYRLHASLDTAKASNVIPMEARLCGNLVHACYAYKNVEWTLYACPAAGTLFADGSLVTAGALGLPSLGSAGLRRCGATGAPAKVLDVSSHIDVREGGVVASRYDPPDVAEIVPPGAGDSYVVSCLRLQVMTFDEDWDYEITTTGASDHFLVLDSASPDTWGESLQAHLTNLRGLSDGRGDNGCGVLAACFSSPVRVAPNATFSVNAGCTRSTFDDSPGLQVRWDWEDDGTWDTAFGGKTASHAYGSEGRRVIRMEVVDADGGTAQATASVLVARPPPVGPPPPPSDNQTSSGGGGSGGDPGDTVATHPGGADVPANTAADKYYAPGRTPGASVQT